MSRRFDSIVKQLNCRFYSETKANITAFEKIPGPYRFPIIGNLHLYKLGIFQVYQYHKVLNSLHKKYGPLVRQDLGSSNTVIHVFDPQDAKTVYKEEGKMPYVSPLQETVQIYRKERNLSPGLGNTNGEEWYRLRSAVRQMMLRPREVQYYLPMINETAIEFVHLLERKKNADNEVPTLRDEVGKWSRESAGKIIFETSLGCMKEGETEKRAQTTIDLNRKIFKLSGELKFSLPIYKYIKTPKWKSLLEAEDEFNSHGLQLIKDTVNHIKKLEAENKLCEKEFNFMSYLLSKPELSDKDVVIIAMSLFSDGLSTTVPTLLYNLYCLSVNEDVQEKAYEEVKSVVGESPVITEQHINKMSYLKAVVKETFRVYPNGTEISRIINSDLVLSGYHVPKKTHVNLNQTVNFNSEVYFKDANKYEPARWLRGDNVEDIHPYLLIPFGHGTRTCAGRRFAEQDMFVLLAQVLLNYRLSYPKEDKPFEQVYYTLLFPKHPVRVRFNKR